MDNELSPYIGLTIAASYIHTMGSFRPIYLTGFGISVTEGLFLC